MSIDNRVVVRTGVGNLLPLSASSFNGRSCNGRGLTTVLKCGPPAAEYEQASSDATKARISYFWPVSLRGISSHPELYFLASATADQFHFHAIVS